MTKDENIKTIRFPVKTDERLTGMANKCGLSKLGLFICMVDYFYKTKKDPRDLNDELLKNAIHKKTDNIVAFIRTQEQELLIPIKKDGERIHAAQVTLIDYFNRHIISQNKQQKEVNSMQEASLKKIADFLARMDVAQLEKAKLKKRFSSILEYYIKQREQLSMLSKQADKDELVRFVREQLDGL